MLIYSGFWVTVILLSVIFLGLLPLVAALAGLPVLLGGDDRPYRIGRTDVLYSGNEICHRAVLRHHLPTVARNRSMA